MHQARGGVKFDGWDFQCPMRGKRALEVSLHGFRDFFAALTGSLAADLFMLWHGLRQEDIADLTCTYETAKAYVELEIKTHTQYWQTLPWSLVRLADWDAARARKSARQLLDEFSSSAQEERFIIP